MKNEDISKNAALIPPSFGSPSADALGTGTYLTPNLAPGGMAVGTISAAICPSYSRLRLAKTQAIPALAVLADPVPLAVIPM